jgi:hypothetical protein
MFGVKYMSYVKENVPAKESSPPKGPRLPQEDGLKGRSVGAQAPPSQGPQARSNLDQAKEPRERLICV